MDDTGHRHTAEKHSFFSDLVRFALIALLIVVPFRLFIAQPFIVNGQSMAPTFDSGEYLIVDQISYEFEEPDRGDVLVFRYPKDPDQFYIKRLIGLPGETVEIKNGTVTIHNDAHPNGQKLVEPYTTTTSPTDTRVTLSEDEYFVLGDNRTASSDSRRWGPLNERFIQGRPVLRLLPVSALEVFPGAYQITTG